jgi:hypothetical protein
MQPLQIVMGGVFEVLDQSGIRGLANNTGSRYVDCGGRVGGTIRRRLAASSAVWAAAGGLSMAQTGTGLSPRKGKYAGKLLWNQLDTSGTGLSRSGPLVLPSPQ